MQEEIKDRCTLSNEELIEKCRQWVSKLAETGGKAWVLSVPVNFNRDPDMLFNELGNRLAAATSPKEQVEDRIEKLMDALKRTRKQRDKAEAHAKQMEALWQQAKSRKDELRQEKNDLQARISELEGERVEEGKGEAWISVDDRLPESGKKVLFSWTNRLGKRRTSVGFYAAKHSVPYEHDDTAFDYGDYSEEKDEYYYPVSWVEAPSEVEYTAEVSNVTHWMPLPPSPIEAQKKNG